MWPGGGLGQQNFALMPSWRRHSWLYPEAALQQLLFAEFLLFSVSLRGCCSQCCAEDGCVFTGGCKQRFFCHYAKRYCKLQQPYYLLVGLALSLGEVALVTCQKIDTRRGGLVLIIYRRSCSTLKRWLEKKFESIFLNAGNRVDCLKIYYGLHIKGKTYFGFWIGQ